MKFQTCLVLVSVVPAILTGQLVSHVRALIIPSTHNQDSGNMPQIRLPKDRHQSKPELPEPPSTPPPDGQRIPGGGLGESAVCPTTSQPLTAITPVNVYGTSLSERSTLWFYMPYTTKDIATGDFSIFTADDSERIYKTRFSLPDQPGLVSITLPDTAPVSLESGQRYHWYLKIPCVSRATSKAYISINGWIDRLASTPERRQQLTEGSLEIWYDAVHQLTTQLQTTQSTTTEQAWSDVLKSVGLEAFTQVPIHGPLILLD